MNPVALTEYPDRDTLMRTLAALVSGQLRAALATKGRASLAVPGGTTPGPFLQALSQEKLAWDRVSVLPTDERLVLASDARSNLGLIEKTLKQDEASVARLVALFDPAEDPGVAQARVEEVLPLDILVIGMGADMHTASLFPDAPELPLALAETAPPLMVLKPESQPEARISLTAPVLRAAEAAHILIAGPEKKAALERAQADGPFTAAPIRVVFTAACPVTVHYAD
ncbi:MAG: 6-phosphogluconolactonase [Pseudomonadota bacterium]